MHKTILTSILIIFNIIAISQPFERIISLSPAATFNLMELDCKDNIVGVTSFCDLSDNKNLVVASAINMNMEKVIALKPDAVIYTTMFKPNQIERLKQFGIHTELFESPKDWDETCEQFIRLGKLVGKQNKAIHYIDSLSVIMKKVTSSIPQQSKQPKYFIEIGAKPLFCAIPNTFMHDYIEVMGGINIAADQNGGTITREKVIMKNPDIIVLVTMGNVSNEEKQTWNSFTDLSATKNKQIHIVDASLACRPTPYNFLNTIIELKRLIYTH